VPQQSGAVLTQMSAGFLPFAQGLPHQRTMPLRGLPFVGGEGGMAGSLLGMAATPAVTRMMGGVGMVPMGVGHDQNVYDVMMNQRFTAMQMQAMREAAESDRESIVRSMRGLAAVTGTPFGAEQRRLAGTVAGSAVMAAPVFAEMMPEFVDQMGGQRGSAAVLANRMIQAGRYRLDPVTGRMGMSAESVGRETRMLMDRMYSEENIAGTQGFRAGQMGALFQELQGRGMLPGAGPGGQRAEAARAVQDLGFTDPGRLRRAAESQRVDMSRGVQGLSATDLDRLQSDPAVADRLRSFDAERVKRSLRSYTSAVAAMRDIFGDMGRPNAPMQELVAGLEAMTMGSMAQIDPGRLGMMARQTHNLARQTGVTLDNALMLQQHAGARAQQMGLEPIFGVQATQGALGFGGAYRAQGHAAHVAWGAMNADQVQQLDTNLRVQAAGSNMANRMAVALRVADTVGGFQQGTQAGRYAAAVRAGLNQFRDDAGRWRSVNLNDDEFVGMLTGARTRGGVPAGVGEGDVRTMLGETSVNREFVERNRLADVVRRAQGTDEVHPFVAHRMQETLYTRLRDQLVRRGVPGGEAATRAREASSSAAQRATDRMFRLSTEEFSNADTRTQRVAEIIGEELTGGPGGDPLRGMGVRERDVFLRQTAGQFYGHAERLLQSSTYRAFGSLQNVHRLTNQQTLDEADRQQMRARFTSEMQESLAPLGRGTLMSRALDAFQNARADDPEALRRALAQSLGGVRTADINQALLPQFRRVLDRRKAVEALERRIQDSQDPEERASLMAQLAGSRGELNAQATELASVGARFGMFATGGLGHEELGRAAGTTRGLAAARADIAGLTGGFGQQVTTQQIQDIRSADPKIGRQGTAATATEAMAVLTARRARDVDTLTRYAQSEAEVARLGGLSRRTIAQQNRLDAATAQRATFLGSADKGGLTDDQRSVLAEHEQMARQRYGQGISASQARLAAVGIMAANVGNVPDEDVRAQMAGLNITDDDQARALIRVLRRQTPSRASPEDVAKTLEQYKGTMTEAEARSLLDMRLRASRLGISQKEVEAKQGKRLGPAGEMRAIEELFQDRAAGRWEVSQSDIDEFKKRHGAPTARQIEDFRKAFPRFARDDDRRIVDVMAERGVRNEVQAAGNRAFEAFWAGGEGEAFREQVSRTGQDVENVAMRLIESPQMVQRLGSRAIEMNQQLTRGQQRLRQLALYHTGGDLARLQAGNLRVDQSVPEGRQSYDRVMAEVRAINAQAEGAVGELQEQEGRPGRQFQLGDEGEATLQVIDREVKAGRMTKAAGDAARKAILSPERRRQVSQRAAELGTEANARRVAGISPDVRELTDLQRARIAGIRFGAGNEDEARLLYGEDRWYALKEADRAKTLARMQAAMPRAEAMRMLGLDEARVATDRDAADRVAALTAGLGTDTHLRQLANIDTTLNLNTLSKEDRAAYGERLLAVKQGIATEDWARHRMGLPGSPLSPLLQLDVRRVRTEAGDRMEARRLLGLTGVEDKNLNDRQRARLKETAYSVGLARRLDPGQEHKLMEMADTEGRMRRMAEEHGVSFDVMHRALAGPDPFRTRTGAETAGAMLDVLRGTGPAGEALTFTGEDEKARTSAAGTAQAGRDRRNKAAEALARTQGEIRDVEARLAGAGLSANEREALVARRDKLVGQRAAHLEDMQRGTEIERTAHSGLAERAKKAGVTTAEMMAGRRSERGLTALSAGEQGRFDRASRDYSQNLAIARREHEAVAAQQRRLAEIGDSGPGRARVEELLGAAQGREAEATLAQRRALESVQADAAARGTTAERYLLTREGKVDEGARQQFRRLALERQEQGGAIADIARVLHLKPSDLKGVLAIPKMLLDAQAEAMRQENRPATEVVKDILTEYGYAQGDQPDETARRVAGMLEGTRGRAMGRDVLESARNLRKRAETRKGGQPGLRGVDEMADRYFEALKADPDKRDKMMLQLQRDYGFELSHDKLTSEGKKQFRRFEQDIQFQQQEGFLGFGRVEGGSEHRRGVEASLGTLFSRLMTGDPRPPAEGGGRQGQAQDMRLSGSVTLRGDQLDMSGAWGGGLRFPPPGGE
jgi:hypothetical protein